MTMHISDEERQALKKKIISEIKSDIKTESPLGVPIPPAVWEHYDSWHKQHQRTGEMPRWAPCGLAENNEELICDFADAGPDLLQKIATHNNALVLIDLKIYDQKPSETLAMEIARRMVYTEVAHQFVLWLDDDDAPALGYADHS
jgi:hypothetical protein